MKKCPYCKVNIGGDLKRCPLCQSAIQGEDDEKYWPKVNVNKSKSRAYQITLFIVISCCVVLLALDFVFLQKEHIHYSPIAVLWVAVLGWLFERIVRNHHNILKTLFMILVTVSVVVYVSELYLNWVNAMPYRGISVEYVIPIMCSANMIFNVVYSFIDQNFADHSLIYIIVNILIGVVPWICMFLQVGMPSLTWSICLTVNTIAFVWLLVFKGRIALEEFQKRLHM